MSKTREIEGWVYISKNANYNGACFYTGATPAMTNDFAKAKLIIEVPEKKITISESEFDEVISDHIKENRLLSDGNPVFTASEIKQKLFGSEK